MANLTQTQWMWIIGAVIAVAVLGSLGYYFYSKGQVGREGVHFQTGFGVGASNGRDSQSAGSGNPHSYGTVHGGGSGAHDLKPWRGGLNPFGITHWKILRGDLNSYASSGVVNGVHVPPIQPWRGGLLGTTHEGDCRYNEMCIKMKCPQGTKCCDAAYCYADIPYTPPCLEACKQKFETGSGGPAVLDGFEKDGQCYCTIYTGQDAIIT